MGAEGWTLLPVRDLPVPPPNFTDGETVAGANFLCARYAPGALTLITIYPYYFAIMHNL